MAQAGHGSDQRRSGCRTRIDTRPADQLPQAIGIAKKSDCLPGGREPACSDHSGDL